MLTPEYLLRISEGGEAIAEELHQSIIEKIIQRIINRLDREDGYILTATDKWQIETIQQAGFLLVDIRSEIAERTGLMQTEIAEAMEDAGVEALKYDDKIYRDAGLSPTPLEQSPHLIRIMQRTYEATAGDWSNFTGTMVTSAHDAFINECNRAYTLVNSGAMSYSEALRDVINNICSNGVEVEYPSSRKDTIETATLRCIRTGTAQATAEIQLARMDEMGWDLVITTAHLGARPTHQKWQGQVFSRSGTSAEHPDFKTATRYGQPDGLCGINCRHTFLPYTGSNPFEDYDAEENRKAYEIQQRQRELERRIRKTKRECMGLQEAVSDAKTDESRQKLARDYERKAALLSKQNAAYNEYCDNNGLKRLSERVTIARWDRSQAAKARAAAKRWNDGKDAD